MANAESSSANVVSFNRDRVIVPALLGLGLLSLYALPVASAGSGFGPSMDVTFSDVRTLMGWAGYGWVNLIAMVGIVAAAAASLVSLPAETFPRRAIMIGGSGLGLAIPLFLLFTGARYLGLDADGGFGAGVSVGGGLMVYTLACIASLTWSATRATSGELDQHRGANQPLRVRLADKVGVVVPVTMGVGVAAALVLPPYDVHPMYMTSNPGFWDVIDIERQGVTSHFTWMVLLGLGAAIITTLALTRVLQTFSRKGHLTLLKWGPVAALLLPLGFWLRWIGGLQNLDRAFDMSKLFLDHVGSGVVVYSMACIIASVLGFMSRQGSVDGGPRLTNSMPAQKDLAVAPGPGWMKDQQ